MHAPRTYEHMLAHLYQRMNFETQRQRQAENLRLIPVRRLLERLGNPQLRFAVIHIAGTKGKGSTAAMLEASLREAGYQTGLYTSPHLHTLRERIRLQGQPAPPGLLVQGYQALFPHLERDAQLTVFDVLTALAFWVFAQQGVEVAVVEVGLGGRLDSTNVVAPSLCVITRLGKDHTEVLGPTLRSIAYEKAGILKPGVPALTAPQRREALNVLQRVAQDRGALLHTLEGWQARVVQVTPQGQRFAVTSPTGEAWEQFLPLLGPHQRENALLALAALHMLGQWGWPVTLEHGRRGLAQVHWPARFEVLHVHPPLVIDGAHTPDALRAVGRTLREAFPHQRWQVVLGLSRGKPVEVLARALQRWVPVQAVWVTQARHPRAQRASELAARLQGLGLPVQGCFLHVSRALKAAWAIGEPVLVTGSLFVAAEAREAWARWGYMLPPATDPPAAGQV